MVRHHMRILFSTVYDWVLNFRFSTIQNFRRHHRTLCDDGSSTAKGIQAESHILLI